MWDILEQWDQLTTAERAAIEASDWEAFETRQKQKTSLRERIDSVLQESREGDQVLGWQSEWRRLIEAEKANANLLEERLQATRAKLDGMNRSSLQLGRLRSAYSTDGQSYWNSYS